MKISMLQVTVLITAICCVWLWSAQVLAQGLFATTETDQPIDITADELELLQQQQQSIFTGNVVVVQGDARLSTEHLVVFFDDENQIRRIEAEGQVEMIDLQRTATSERAVYDRQQDVLHLSGQAVVTQGENRVAGDEIILYLGENRSLVRSRDQGRVRAVIIPESKTEKP